MVEHSGESLEFSAVDDDDQLLQLSRSSFRVRVADREGFSFRFGTLKLPLADLGIGGVSLLSDKQTALAQDDIICNCELRLEEEHFSGLRGRVVHHSLDSDGRTVTGIQWMDLNLTTMQRFQAVLSQLRKHLFKRD